MRHSGKASNNSRASRAPASEPSARLTLRAQVAVTSPSQEVRRVLTPKVSTGSSHTHEPGQVSTTFSFAQGSPEPEAGGLTAI